MSPQDRGIPVKTRMCRQRHSWEAPPCGEDDGNVAGVDARDDIVRWLSLRNRKTAETIVGAAPERTSITSREHPEARPTADGRRTSRFTRSSRSPPSQPFLKARAPPALAAIPACCKVLREYDRAVDVGSAAPGPGYGRGASVRTGRGESDPNMLQHSGRPPKTHGSGELPSWSRCH